MRVEIYIIENHAPVYQAAMGLEADHPDDPPIAVSEWLMDSFAHAGDREQTRFWRAIWAYFMERGCAAATAEVPCAINYCGLK